jgi:N-sulfoglucosamine sulfohydrolase
MLLEACEDRDTARHLVIYLSDNGRAFPGQDTLYDEGIHLPLDRLTAHAGQARLRNDAMVSWIDIVPTILDWTRVSRTQPLPGRSILPILEQSDPPGWDRVFASHNFHEIQQYYPMRALRTREYEYIVNLAAPLEFPIAGDIASSPTWRAIEARPAVGLGARTTQAFSASPARRALRSQEGSRRSAQPRRRSRAPCGAGTPCAPS